MRVAKPEDVIAGKKRPFTGKEYLESLRDGREVYVYGERVADVTAHPELGIAVLMSPENQSGPSIRAPRERAGREA